MFLSTTMLTISADFVHEQFCSSLLLDDRLKIDTVTSSSITHLHVGCFYYVL